MRQPADDCEISFVEELDPDPPPRSGFSRVREPLLGVLLLVGVLTWSAVHWWEQQEAQSRYALGHQAAERREWDQSHLHFTAASGYRDAASRAAEAARQIAEREKEYARAMQAARSNDWPTALHAARAVSDIQPAYKGISAIAYQAGKHVHSLALSGTVALRTEVSTPGLYYHDGTAWHWLQGSDRHSSVRGSGPRGHVVYDVPSPDWTPNNRPVPTPDRRIHRGFAGSPCLKGRRLVVAPLATRSYSFNRNYTFTTLVLDPAEYEEYRWGERGVWAFRSRRDPLSSSAAIPGSDLLLSYEITYQAFDSAVTRTVALLGEKWSLVALSPTGDKALAVERAESPEGASRDLLYVVSGDGREPKLLYAHTGVLVQPRFDHAGRYVLFTTFSPAQSGQARQHTIILLDTLGEDPPQVVAQAPIYSYHYYPWGFSPLSAGFLSSSAFDRKVAVSRWNSYRLSLWLFDPTNPTVRPQRTAMGIAPMDPLLIVERPDAPFLAVLGQDPRDRNELVVKSLAGAGSWVTSTLRIEREQILTGAYVRGDLLVYTTTDRHIEYGKVRQLTVKSVPLAELGTSQPRVTTVYSVANREGEGPPSDPISLGPQMLAYVRDGQLHARTYDAAIDLPLERGLEGFYDFSSDAGFLGR